MPSIMFYSCYTSSALQHSQPDYNTIKVADFGLSKFVSEQSHMKTTCGTPGYVAPEVLDPYLPFTSGYGPEVDLWSMGTQFTYFTSKKVQILTESGLPLPGVVLYIMLCGFPPFYDDSTAVLFKQIRKGEFSFPSPYWDGVSDEAKDLVSKMLVVDSGKRYTAQQCLDHPWIAKAGEVTSKKLHSGHRAFLLIRKLPIFDNIDPACLQQVTAMLKLVKVEQGQHVIQAGEVGDCMYFINAGTVQVFVNGNEVDRLTTGDFFGEVALTVSKQRTADVKSLGNSNAHSKTKGAAEPVELFQLMRSDFEFVMERFPILKTRLAQIGQARVRRATADEAGSRSGESSVSPERTRGATTTKSSGTSPEPTSAGPTRAGAGAGAGAAAPKKNSKACSQQ